MGPKEICSGIVFGISKMQLVIRLQNRIIIGDFCEVNGIFRGFIFGMYSNPSVNFGRNERVCG